MHVPLVPCLALAGNSNKLQLQAMRYMLHASYGMSMPRPECVVSCKILLNCKHFIVCVQFIVSII